MQQSYGNGLTHTNAVPMATMLQFPVEALPPLQPGDLAKKCAAQLASLRHSPYEAAQSLLSYRKQDLTIRTDPMLSQLAKATKLGDLLSQAGDDIQRTMDNANQSANKIAQLISTTLYPAPDANQQLLYEMRMQSAWHRALRALDKGASPYGIIQEAGENTDRVLMAALLRELPAYAAMGQGEEARRERENLTDAITRASRTLLTPSERDAAGINAEVSTGIGQLRTTVGFIQMEIQSQSGSSLYSGMGKKATMLVGWSKGFTFGLDDSTLGKLAQIEADDMSKLS